MQKENVGGDFGSGVGLEGGIGKADCAQQIRAVGEVAPDAVVLLVQRVAAGDECRDTARTDLFERLGKEIVVNRAGEEGRAAIGGIEDRIVAERNVPDHGVEKIVGERCFLESLGEDGRIRIQGFCDPRGDAVEFDAGSAAAGQEFIRHEAEEMADAH
ncbi:MAG: hypothetical protein ABSE42_06430 [Bryobacteraceae bacterium]